MLYFLSDSAAQLQWAEVFGLLSLEVGIVMISVILLSWGPALRFVTATQHSAQQPPSRRQSLISLLLCGMEFQRKERNNSNFTRKRSGRYYLDEVIKINILVTAHVDRVNIAYADII